MAGAPVDRPVRHLRRAALTGYAGRRLFGARAGLYAALVLGSCLLLGGVFRQIDSLDMGLSAMMTIALCALLIAQRDQATPKNTATGCWPAGPAWRWRCCPRA
jgi:4-amino-4-deoxy-L-arabinose transferase-like glycosyltransferase